LKVREYRSDDYERIIELFYDTVHSVNSIDYPEILLNAWAPKDIALYKLENRFLNNYTVVAETDGIITGFGNVHGKGYLDCLYTHKNYQRMGVATLIADDIEQYFYRDGIQIITTDASITAKPFFEKRGYIVIKKQSVECRGQFLLNYNMQKKLCY